MTTPWVDSRSPARAFCSTSRIVLPRAFIIRTASKTDLSTLGDRPIDGSSRMIRDGSSIRQRANSTSLCSPPDRLPAFLPDHAASCGNVSSICAILRASSDRSLMMYPPSSTFSLTVMSRNRLWFCGTCAMPRSSIWRGLRPATGSPRSRMLPRRGRSSPLIVASRVDLPAPLGPTTQVIPPSGTVSDTPCSTSPPPYPATIPSRTRAAARAAGGPGAPGSPGSAGVIVVLCGAEVGIEHPRVPPDGLRRPGRDHRSVVQDRDTPADAHHEIHVVLHDEERPSRGVQLPDPGRNVLDQRRVHPAGGLVE